ncbi:aminoglycoside phosphotransferase family protein [Actibacterium sp. 188UL27-1]|uniref:aminoglycoside phosphotransferase family protein n=1 Tax=Actibacterium sp. 188UL27-1 TaxID=2786961 RepID=UPI0019580809|nr:phosphotransferase [Actibacterium sp. 188UL27-1]MBM7067229.1 phosphotransferase [Actibacterium sp. 188UL27-1]
MSRATTITGFLTAHGWGAAKHQFLTGDASNRRYIRLELGDRRAILMDAPVTANPDTPRFVEVADYLGKIGLRPPGILAQNLAQGVLLLEDLGDAIFARVLEQTPDLEPQLYVVAADVLLHLRHSVVLPGLAQFTPHVMTNLTDLAYQWYCAEGDRPPDHTHVDTALCDALTRIDGMQPVVALRDYHAENLIWLGDASGTNRAGLLDFQDAVLAHPAYDLVSLLEDARRDVTPATRQATITHYLSRSGDNPDQLGTALATLGAQRNLRILGIFARLSLRDRKHHYIDLIPRVWAHLQRDLQHPALAAVKAAVMPLLPDPTLAKLERLRRICATTPAP